MGAHAGASRWAMDVLERVGWTALEASAGVLVVSVTPLDTWWALPIATGLAAVKSWAAKHVGVPNTASTLPAGQDPAALTGPVDVDPYR
ncbi:hypothetical protein ACFPC0_11165 [Streptomyces andamanensis]|uniref:Uncharacterized protein n=1 Tax=Streptomyces andamanensis TaxID=1565035 RepID=A0ABV8TCL0_9ACTN